MNWQLAGYSSALRLLFDIIIVVAGYQDSVLAGIVFHPDQTVQEFCFTAIRGNIAGYHQYIAKHHRHAVVFGVRITDMDDPHRLVH